MSYVWEACLPIGATLKQDEAPDADIAWLMSRGIEGEALSVLRLVRRDVLPLVRSLRRRRLLREFSFLVHDRTSGVPTSAEDATAYIHMRVWLSKNTGGAEVFPKKWCFTRPAKEIEEIAGIDRKSLRRGDIRPAWRLINEQSEWLLRVVDSCRPQSSDIDVLRQVRQFLHYFANMSQMRIS